VTEEANHPLVSVIMPCYKMGRWRVASGEWEENLKPETRDLRPGTGKNHPNFSIQNLKLLSIDLGKNWPKQNL